jgi:DNA-binding transcriptional LysR family regulator
MTRTKESRLPDPFDGLSLDRLRSFVAVVDAGGFAKAAPGDPSRQSQLSRQVRDIERSLGVAVLRRAGRSVVPTEAGQRLRTAVADLAAGLAAARGLHEERVDVVFAAGDSVLRWLALPALASHAAALRARVSLATTSDVFGEITAGRAQLGLVRARPMPAGLVARPVGPVGFALFVPRVASRGAPMGSDLDAVLDRFPLADVSADREPFEALVTAMGRPLRAALTCETFPQAARAVATGRFAAVLPTFATSELPASLATPLRVPGLRVRSSRLTLIARARTLETEPVVAALFAELAATVKATLAGA